MPTIFEVGEARIGVLICYEGFYPHLARRYRLDGANMLAVLTNDAWWGHSVFPLLHSRLIAARVREAGVPTVRAANNGISSYTDSRGRQLARSELDARTVLRVEVPPAGPEPPLYARTGDILVLVLWLLVGAGVLFGLVRRRR